MARTVYSFSLFSKNGPGYIRVRLEIYPGLRHPRTTGETDVAGCARRVDNEANNEIRSLHQNGHKERVLTVVAFATVRPV